MFKKVFLILVFGVFMCGSGMGAMLYEESFEYVNDAAMQAEWTPLFGSVRDLNTTYASDGAKSGRTYGGSGMRDFLPGVIDLPGGGTISFDWFVDTANDIRPYNFEMHFGHVGFGGSLYAPGFTGGNYALNFYQGTPNPDTPLGLTVQEGWNEVVISVAADGTMGFQLNGTVSAFTIAPGYWNGFAAISMFDWTTTAFGTSGIVDNIKIYDGPWVPDAEPVAKISEVGADPCAPDIQVLEGDSAGDTYEIVLLEEPPASSTVTVQAWADPNDPAQITLTPGSGGVGNLLSMTFTNANWSTPQTITVVALDETNGAAPFRTVELSHNLIVTPDPCATTDPNWVAARITNGSLTVTIIEDDEFRGLEVSPVSVSVIEGGATDTFTVKLKSQPGTPSSLDVDVSSVYGQVDVSPSTLTFTNSDYSTAQTVTVTAIDDDLGEDDPHAGAIDISVPLDVSWNPTAAFSDTFEDSDASAWGFVPTAPDANALEEGTSSLDVGNGGVLMPRGGIAVSPYDIDPCSPYYRVTTQVDMRLNGNAVSHVQIYLRADPCEVIWEWHGLRVEYWTGGLSIISTGIQPAVPQSPVLASWDPCSVYEIVVTDLNNTVSASITEVGNPGNTVSTTAIGDLSVYGKGSKVMLGRDWGAYTEYNDHLMFKVEEPLALPTPDQIEWAGLSETVAVSVGDNDCGDRATQQMDTDDDCDVDLVDFAVFAAEYMECVKPNGGICD